MSEKIIDLSLYREADQKDAIEVVREFFDCIPPGPKGTPAGDAFLAWLYDRGYMVLPIPAALR